MRISTAFFHERAAAGIAARQGEVHASQVRLASGKRISTAADDPVGAALSLLARGELAQTERWQSAQGAARTTLSITESTLAAMHDALAAARDTVLAAGNPAMSPADRQTLATQLRSDLTQLVGLANAKDGDGSYLFAGFDNREAPFTIAGTSVTYNGDAGQRFADVGPGVRLRVAQGGDETFLRIRDGNGVFSTSGLASNTGNGIIGTGRITDATLVTGNAYEIRIGAGGATYDVWDMTVGAAVSTGNPFVDGGTIALRGIALEINGQPAAGDVFRVSPSQPRSIFERVARAVTALENPASGAPANAWRAGELGGVLQDLDAAMNRLLEARGVAGNALSRLDVLAGLAQDRTLAQSAQISQVEDLDYAKASTELNARNLALEAALAAYAQVGRRNLFDYL
jgi:flagellar hook-associated protein 3 FlgL